MTNIQAELIVRYANYVEQGVSDSARFDLAHATNRDNSNYPYWMLRELFLSRGIELNTPDVNAGRDVAFELHMNALRRDVDVPQFVLLYETPQICPDNGDMGRLARYQKVFTWNDDLVDGVRYIKLNFTNKPIDSVQVGWGGRGRFCCLIAGNKSVGKHDPKELYSQRVKTIRWFERNAPDRFDLYGSGWDVPAARYGRFGWLLAKIQRPLYRLGGLVAFPSYRGRVQSKFETLQKYRFVICYENVKDTPGYITEKIFDAFFAGCVPVYWGAPNVLRYIPEECFVDRTKFDDHESLYQYLSDMTVEEYGVHQRAIRQFLQSEKAKPFYAEAFASVVAGEICAELDIPKAKVSN